MWRRLQPYATRAATLCDRAATLCTWQALNESLLALPSLAAAQHSMQVYGDLQATPAQGCSLGRIGMQPLST